MYGCSPQLMPFNTWSLSVTYGRPVASHTIQREADSLQTVRYGCCILASFTCAAKLKPVKNCSTSYTLVQSKTSCGLVETVLNSSKVPYKHGF